MSFFSIAKVVMFGLACGVASATLTAYQGAAHSGSLLSTTMACGLLQPPFTSGNNAMQPLVTAGSDTRGCSCSEPKSAMAALGR